MCLCMGLTLKKSRKSYPHSHNAPAGSAASSQWWVETPSRGGGREGGSGAVGGVLTVAMPSFSLLFVNTEFCFSLVTRCFSPIHLFSF